MDKDFYRKSGLKISPPIKDLSYREANNMLDKWHYLGGVRGILYAYGHSEGCLVFANCRSRVYEQNMKSRGLKIIELARMVGKDNHIWSMSSLTSLTIKQIKKLNKYDLVVTYSDPFAGHEGMYTRVRGGSLMVLLSQMDILYSL